jgi:hypothetical protein
MNHETSQLLGRCADAALRSAALAAALLEAACDALFLPGNPRLETTRELAGELKEELEKLTGSGPETAAVEGALLAADLASLAACAVPDLPEGESRSSALAAAHLGAGAARALHALVGTVTQGESDGQRYALADATSAAWRARFAAGQADGLGIGP